MKIIAALLLFIVTSCASALEVDKLLKLAEKYEVPQPHKDSKVIKILAFRRNNENCYLLGLVEPQNKKRALVAFEYKEGESTEDDWKDFDGSLKGVGGVGIFGPVSGVNEGLITGIQLIRHGQKGIGIELIEKSLKEDAGHPQSPFLIPENLPVEEALARSCLSASLNEIITEKSDFKKIKQQIGLLIKENPKLKNKATDYYIEALSANINHHPPVKGSMEEVIENYLMSGDYDGMTHGNREKNKAKE